MFMYFWRNWLKVNVIQQTKVLDGSYRLASLVTCFSSWDVEKIDTYYPPRTTYQIMLKLCDPITTNDILVVKKTRVPRECPKIECDQRVVDPPIYTTFYIAAGNSVSTP